MSLFDEIIKLEKDDLYDVLLTNEDAWNLWENPANLIEAASRVVNIRSIVMAGAECAQEALRFLPEDEKIPREAVKLAMKWASGAKVSRARMALVLDRAWQAGQYGTAAVAARNALMAAAHASQADLTMQRHVWATEYAALAAVHAAGARGGEYEAWTKENDDGLMVLAALIKRPGNGPLRWEVIEEARETR